MVKPKLQKPYPTFPLTPRTDGRFQKKIRGTTYYFGRGFDADVALQEFQEVRDDLEAGRVPRKQLNDTRLAVRDLVNRFLSDKQIAMDNSELSPLTFQAYHAECSRMIIVLGRNQPVESLAIEDFRRYRLYLSKRLGLLALGVAINRIRTIFKYAYTNDMIDRPVRFGQVFNAPTKVALRKDKQKRPPRVLEADEIQALLDTTNIQMRAIILLALNAGYGNSDIATLPMRALDLKGGWVTYPRPKTAVERRCPLWPETIEAIKKYLPTRTTPNTPEDSDLVFITQRGNRWVRFRGDQRGWQDSLSLLFGNLLAKLGFKRNGVNFYSLRHTFATQAGESTDQVAVDSIMGHVDPSMGANYRHGVSNDRLKAVVAVVHDWLFNDTKTD